MKSPFGILKFRNSVWFNKGLFCLEKSAEINEQKANSFFPLKFCFSPYFFWKKVKNFERFTIGLKVFLKSHTNVSGCFFFLFDKKL